MKSWTGLVVVGWSVLEMEVGGQSRSEQGRENSGGRKRKEKKRYVKRENNRPEEKPKEKKTDGSGQHGGLYSARPARSGYPVFSISISSQPAWDKKVETKKVNDLRSFAPYLELTWAALLNCMPVF